MLACISVSTGERCSRASCKWRSKALTVDVEQRLRERRPALEPPDTRVVELDRRVLVLRHKRELGADDARHVARVVGGGVGRGANEHVDLQSLRYGSGRDRLRVLGSGERRRMMRRMRR